MLALSNSTIATHLTDRSRPEIADTENICIGSDIGIELNIAGVGSGATGGGGAELATAGILPRRRRLE